MLLHSMPWLRKITVLLIERRWIFVNWRPIPHLIHINIHIMFICIYGHWYGLNHWISIYGIHINIQIIFWISPRNPHVSPICWTSSSYVESSVFWRVSRLNLPIDSGSSHVQFPTFDEIFQVPFFRTSPMVPTKTIKPTHLRPAAIRKVGANQLHQGRDLKEVIGQNGKIGEGGSPVFRPLQAALVPNFLNVHSSWCPLGLNSRENGNSWRCSWNINDMAAEATKKNGDFTSQNGKLWNRDLWYRANRSMNMQSNNSKFSKSRAKASWSLHVWRALPHSLDRVVPNICQGFLPVFSGLVSFHQKCEQNLPKSSCRWLSFVLGPSQTTILIII